VSTHRLSGDAEDVPRVPPDTGLSGDAEDLPRVSPDTAGHALTYAAAGVDIEAGERAVELMNAAVERTRRPEVVGGLGGFAGLFALDTTRYRQPLLACSTDGVGTKLAVAQALGEHGTVGIDLVAMVVDDLVACGAEPLFLQDYIACGKVLPERVAAIVAGIAEGCLLAGCALVGGETAEHGDQMGAEEYDLSATAVGVVEADALLGPDRVRAGDALVALGSSGLHSNGYSLVRQVLRAAGLPLSAEVPELGRTVGAELLTPTRIYVRDCLALLAATRVRALAHITGGGIPGNLVRVLPPHLDAVLDRGTWAPQPIFALVAGAGRVAAAEMDRTFNLGVGMIAVVDAADADRAVGLLRGRDVPAWVLGEVTAGTGTVSLNGSHPG
jgi:phosphoribosylformylglycinamidine cyclo-ligase